jgi:hypothetical protein
MIRYNTKRYWGYSTDTKPINAQIGDRFLEMDTQLEYVFSDYNKWELIGLTSKPIYTVTVNTGLTNIDQVVIVNSTNPITITLPQITEDSRHITIKNINTGVETILPFSGQSIDGDTSVVVARKNVSLDFQSYNNNWFLT